MKNVAVFASAIAFAACMTATPADAFQSENTLRVGAMWAITGGVALTGKGALNLSKLAVEEINAAGGVKVGGKQVSLELHAYDEACKEQEGLALLSRLKDVRRQSLILSRPDLFRHGGADFQYSAKEAR
jgi:branched-chain amino acid transport system substrate-binding protein